MNMRALFLSLDRSLSFVNLKKCATVNDCKCWWHCIWWWSQTGYELDWNVRFSFSWRIQSTTNNINNNNFHPSKKFLSDMVFFIRNIHNIECVFFLCIFYFCSASANGIVTYFTNNFSTSTIYFFKIQNQRTTTTATKTTSAELCQSHETNLNFSFFIFQMEMQTQWRFSVHRV